MQNRSRKFILFPTLISLFGVFVATIATAAWFQIDQTTPTSTISTADPNINITGYTGYKVNPSLNEYGFPSGEAGNAGTLTRDNYIIQTQDQQGEIDTAFDIPDYGVGYYLVKKNDNGTFKFEPGNHALFTIYNSTTFYTNQTAVPTRGYISELDITEESTFRIRNYYFYNGETKIDSISIEATSGSTGVTTNLDSSTLFNDVTVSTPGVYKVWLDYSNASRGNASADPRPSIYFEKTRDLSVMEMDIGLTGYTNTNARKDRSAPTPKSAYSNDDFFLRGTFNSWSNNESWHFENGVNNIYILSSKALTNGDRFRVVQSDANWWGISVFNKSSGSFSPTPTNKVTTDDITCSTAGTYTFYLLKDSFRLYIYDSTDSPFTIAGQFNTWNKTSDKMMWDSSAKRFVSPELPINKDEGFKVILFGDLPNDGGAAWYGWDKLDSSSSDAYSNLYADGEQNIMCSYPDTLRVECLPTIYDGGFVCHAISVDYNTQVTHVNNSYAITGEHDSWGTNTSNSLGLTVKNANTSTEEHYKTDVYFSPNAKFKVSRFGNPNADWGWSNIQGDSMGGYYGTYLKQDGTNNLQVKANSIGVAFDLYFKPASNTSNPNKIYLSLATYTITLELGTAAAAFGKTVHITNAPTSYTFGTAKDLPGQADMKLGDNQYEYKFEGWYTNAACTQNKTTTIAAGQHENKTFYAKWSKVASPATPSVTIKLYDPHSYFGNAPKVHAWGPYYSVYPDYEYYDMQSVQDNASKRTYWTVDISASYTTGFQFSNDTSCTVSSNDISPLASSPDYFYVATSVSNNKVTLRKYQALSNQTDLYTFYYFDNRTGAWNAPKAYAWKTDALSDGNETLVPNTTDVYQMYEPQNNAWPGVAMTQLESEEAEELNVEASFVWKIQVSSSYDQIIFNDGTGETGNSNQTVNLTSISSHDDEFFVIDRSQTSGSKLTGSWHESVYDVEYYASYFLDGVHQSDELIGGLVSYTFGTEDFDPTPTGTVPDVKNVSLASEATVYKYIQAKVNNETVYYAANTCLAGDVIDGSSSIAVDNSTLKASVFIKYEASKNDHVTILIDASTSGNFDNDANQKWGSIRISETEYDQGDYFTMPSSHEIAPDLYKATLPNSFEFRVTNNFDNRGYYSSGNNNYSTVADTAARNGATYLRINSWSGGNCPATWHTTYAFNQGSATIYVRDENNNPVKYLDGEVDQENGTDGIAMEHGNVTVNKFIYEHGLIVPRGCKIYIDWNDTVYDYDNYYSTPPTYISHSGTSESEINYITPEFSDDHMRFNFYIHNTNTVIMTMVPERGNGYYLVPYNTTYGVESFINAKQMASGGPIYASYSGLHITTASAENPVKYCIQSFLEGKETLYTSLTTKPASVTMGDGEEGNDPVGVISFTANGYYDIIVQNGAISITTYTVDTSFTLNPLDLSQNDSVNSIFAQRTSLVIEVQFTCNNPYLSDICLDISAPAYVGASLYVTNDQLDNPYAYMRANCYMNAQGGTLLSNTTAVDRAGYPIPVNSGATYYAYVLLDYLPRSGANYDNFLTTYSQPFICYLRSNQR